MKIFTVYYLYCFHSYTTDNKLKKHVNVSKKRDYCYPEIPTKDKKILEYNHRKKSLKVPFIVYLDIEFLLKKCIPVKII